MARYDKIGIQYDNTRQADPYLAGRMYHLLQNGKPGSKYLDVGCGSGNYTTRLAVTGLDFCGLDPSEEMLAKAKKKNPDINWKKGTAESIPWKEKSFDGVLVSLSIHHWTDVTKGFAEIARVLKPGGKFLLFTSLPEQTAAYWLKHYFPQMIRDSAAALPAFSLIEEAISHAGMHIKIQEPYFVQTDLKDLFLYSGKHAPERYFDPDFQQGISSFRLLSRQEEIKKGLAQLKEDLANDSWQEIKAKNWHVGGDYHFILAEKPS